MENKKNYEKNVHKIKIGNDTLKVTTEKNLDMGWGIIDDLTIILPSFISKEILLKNKDLANKVVRYSLNKLYKRMIIEGDELLQEIKEIGIEIYKETYIRIPYGDKVAIIRPFIHNSRSRNLKIDIRPFYEISADINGLTITPGAMSDVILYFDDNDVMKGYTKDVYRNQFGMITLFLKEYCSNFLTIIINNDVPEDFDNMTNLNNSSYLYMNENMKTNIEEIKKVINTEINRNKNVRIDKVSNNEGEGIYHMIKKYDVKYIIFFYDLKLLKICLELGKTPYQVYTFVEKFLTSK